MNWFESRRLVMELKGLGTFDFCPSNDLNQLNTSRLLNQRITKVDSQPDHINLIVNDFLLTIPIVYPPNDDSINCAQLSIEAAINALFCFPHSGVLFHIWSTNVLKQRFVNLKERKI